MPRDITVDVELPHPPAEVWLALTDPAALAEWLMGVTLLVGARYYGFGVVGLLVCR